MEIRKIALVTFIAAVLSLLAPSWNLTRTMVGIVSTQPVSGWSFIPIGILALLSSALLPVFFFALYRNNTTLRIPESMKLLSKAGALILGLFVLRQLWIEFVDPGFKAGGGLSNAARTTRHVISLLNICSNATLALLLASFNMHTNEESIPNVSGSRLLDQVTKVAVVLYGLILAFFVMRVLFTPLINSSLSNLASQRGLAMPPVSTLLDTIRDLALQSCNFIAPYVIWKSQSSALVAADSLSQGVPAIPPDQL